MSRLSRVRRNPLRRRMVRNRHPSIALDVPDPFFVELVRFGAFLRREPDAPDSYSWFWLCFCVRLRFLCSFSCTFVFSCPGFLSVLRFLHLPVSVYIHPHLPHPTLSPLPTHPPLNQPPNPPQHLLPPPKTHPRIPRLPLPPDHPRDLERLEGL